MHDLSPADELAEIRAELGEGGFDAAVATLRRLASI